MSGILQNLLKSTKNLPKFIHTSVRYTSEHKVNKLEKYFLVWTGKYKSVGAVPNVVSSDIVEKTRNRMRIRIANYMMAASLLGCLAMVYLGKQDQKRGESVHKMNLDWHKRYEEQQAKEDQQK